MIENAMPRPRACGNSFLFATAVLVVSVSASAQERGMTWGAMQTDPSPVGTSLVSCQGVPAPPGLAKCDAYRGDTSCAATLPLLCVNPARLERPANLYHPKTNGITSDPGFYSGWSGARLALSRPVPGKTLQSLTVANAMCAKQFGNGWRMGEFHDGNVDRSPISMVVLDPSGNTRNISVRAAGEIERLRSEVAELAKRTAVRHEPATGAANRGRNANVSTSVTANSPWMALAEPYPHNALLRLKDVCRLVGMSRSTIYARIEEKTFPQPLRISQRSVRWRMEDLLKWADGLAARR